MRRLAASMTLAILCAGSAVAQRNSLSDNDIRLLVDAFTTYDASLAGGRGYSDSVDGGQLGWAESVVLDSYVKMYHATANRKWLEKVVDHVDRILASAVDPDGDGYVGWPTRRYSIATVRTSALNNRGTATIAPTEARITDVDTVATVSEGDYVLETDATGGYALLDQRSRRVVARGVYRGGQPIRGLTGVTVTVSGAPEPGDKFGIEVRGPEALEYAVHEGMLLHPIALFIEAVARDYAFDPTLSQRAAAYTRFMADNFLRKQERWWLELPDGSGAYRATDSWSERTPNRVLPHNQYLALGRVWLVMKDLAPQGLYLERATAMARNFHGSLRVTGSGYTWSYADWTREGRENTSVAEDTSHGHIDVGFAVEAWKRGVVFSKDDILRLSRTFLDQMWNGSLEKPSIGSRVNTKTGSSSTWVDWIDLSLVEPAVFDVTLALYRYAGSPPRYAPSILAAWAALRELGVTGGG